MLFRHLLLSLTLALFCHQNYSFGIFRNQLTSVAQTKHFTSNRDSIESDVLNDVSSTHSSLATSDSESVHLQLNKKVKSVDDDGSNAPSTSNHTNQDINETHNEGNDRIKLKPDEALVISFVNISNNNETLLSTFESTGWEFLEHYSIHKYSTNLSSCTDIIRQEVKLNLSENATIISLTDLWKSAKFLSQSKEFPFSLRRSRDKNGGIRDEEKVEESIASHIRRIQNVQREKSSSDHIFTNFLLSQQSNISGHDWTYYQNIKMRSRNESQLVLKEFLIWFRQYFPYYYDGCTSCGHARSNTCYGVICPSSDEISSGQAGRTELYLCSVCQYTSRFPRYNDVSKVLVSRKGRCGEYSMLMLRLLRALGYQARWTVDKADHVWTEALLPKYSTTTFHNDNSENSDSSHNSLLSTSISSLSQQSPLLPSITATATTTSNNTPPLNTQQQEQEYEWVHIDPCEAAIDEPLIYQSWGKNQTYIFSYAVDVDSMDINNVNTNSRDSNNNNNNNNNNNDKVISDSSTTNSNFTKPTNTTVMHDDTNIDDDHSVLQQQFIAEDVTLRYTTDRAGVITRRQAEGILNQTYIDELLLQARMELLTSESAAVNTN